MATNAESKIADQKSHAAAEKAYADAAGAVIAKPAAASEAPKAADRPAASKIDAAVAEVKAAPKPAPKKAAADAPKKARKVAVRKAKKTAPKKTVAKQSVAKKNAAKAKPAAKSAAPKALKAAPKFAIPTISQLKDTIMATAKTTDFTKTVKETAADVQTRAKAAYDKLQTYAGEVTAFTKGNVEAIVESGKILGAGVQDMARGEVEAAKGALEVVTGDVKAMAGVKSPTELFKLQGEIARRNFDAVVARYSKNAEVSMKLASDAFAPISSRMSNVAEKISKAA